MLDDQDDVRPMLTQLCRLRSNAGGAGDQRVNLAAVCVGESTAGGDHFQRDLAQLACARLGKYEDVGHQRTFASV
jgi:hypothetical protein